MVINSFTGEYAFLSNFYDCEVFYSGIAFKNSEAAFQAAKCISFDEAIAFRDLSASDAKYRGRRVELRPDWEQIKLKVMEEVVRSKFVQSVHLAKKLIATGDAELIEGNTWGDTYWGVDTRKMEGENHLGIILMELRSQLIAVNVPQFVIRNKSLTGSQSFERAFSDEEEALTSLKKKQKATPQCLYELRKEYPYGDASVWNPRTSSWITATTNY